MEIDPTIWELDWLLKLALKLSAYKADIKPNTINGTPNTSLIHTQITYEDKITILTKQTNIHTYNIPFHIYYYSRPQFRRHCRVSLTSW